MGKRKERRLAAMSNAGRRVKLDLFAEPSGDLGGSSVKDKVDEIGDSEHLNGSPKLPASSGQQLVNPLLLLGQYSDDETEDGSGNSSHDGPGQGFLVDSKDQVEESSGPHETCDTVEVFLDSNLDQQKVGESEGIDSIGGDFPHKLGGTDVKDDNLTVLEEADMEEPSLMPSGSEAQVVGDVISGWKLVMHEERDQYYYWNTETGETSWEAPAVFLQTSQPSAHEYSAPQYNVVQSNPDSIYTNGVMHNCSFTGGALLENNESVGGGFHTERLVGGGHKCVHCGRDVDIEVKDYESENKSWADTLVCLSEQLVVRLKSLQSANGVFYGEDWPANYILELEIRHSDFKSLSSCGSSLHPFWLHSETRLRRLELAIDGQILKTDKSNSSVQVEDANENLPTGTGKLELGETELTEENRGKEGSPDMENGSCENLTGKDGVTAETDHHEMLNDDKGSDSSSKQSAIGLEEGELIENVGHPNNSGPTSSQDGEDIDMDVDMEVEDVVSVEGVVPPPPEPSRVTTEGFFTVPPPPDNEWIPPPPPETEQIPPPPPDEPPEPSYPTMTYTGVGQPFAYADYAVPYNYMHGDIAGSNFYVPAEGGQVVQSNVTISYGAVPSIYGDTAHIPVNSVVPIVYYGLQDGTVPPIDGVIPIETTQIQMHSRPSSSSSLLTDQAGSSHAIPEVSMKSSLANSSFSGKGENKDSDPLSTLARTSTSTIVRESTTASLGNKGAVTVNANALATSTDTKKVSRSKKRSNAVAPSLRSNKKVSSLVEKWKAAKDELQEEEEEDEAKITLTVLEKKRQREIEEWRAQQIASGEAKDNANFQPLRGDWRERVKRKRAQTAGKVVETNEPENTGNHQADLAEVSRPLPSGWQAYWDESSKQVYYGNKITSETSWTRPT